MEVVWNVIGNRYNLPNYATMSLNQEPCQWVTHFLRTGNRKEKATKTLTSSSPFGGKCGKRGIRGFSKTKNDPFGRQPQPFRKK
jgi:hypothetical protein